jgi:NADP-dependent 3-hydroxy acid dehydrogenase YdfG
MVGKLRKIRKQKLKKMKTILITGAAGNLGKSVVEQLHKSGYKILATVGFESELDIFSHLPSVKSSLLNVLDASNVNVFLEENSDIQAAILLVGGYVGGNIHQTDLAQIEKMFQLNFVSAFNIVKPLLAKFEENGSGQFIFIGSRPSLNAEEGKNVFAYALTKSMIFKMAEFVNAEGKNKGISASVIVPSIIDTALNRKSMPDADFSKWVTPESIAKTIDFVLSEEGKMLSEPVLKIYNQS